MEIKSSNIGASADSNQSITKKKQNQSDVKFADELKSMGKVERAEAKEDKESAKVVSDEQKAVIKANEVTEQQKPEDVKQGTENNSNSVLAGENGVLANQIDNDKNKTLTETVIDMLPETDNKENPITETVINTLPETDNKENLITETGVDILPETDNKENLLKETVIDILPESENNKNNALTAEEIVIDTPSEPENVLETNSQNDKEQATDINSVRESEGDKSHDVNKVINSLTDVLSKLNQQEDNTEEIIKDIDKKSDIDIVEPKTEAVHSEKNIFNTKPKVKDRNDKEGADVINNDYNIDNKDKLPQMMPNMNFGSDGQPFSSFMNNENAKNQDKQPERTVKNLAEEAAILSTMAENIAMANKVNSEIAPVETTEKIVVREDGIKKIDTETNMVKEIIVKHDTIIMNEADVEVFANLVDGKDVNVNNLAPDSLQKSVHVSKTLADMLAKSMEDNKPIRIEFDNGISIIIKISKDGKLSADFLPSTQVAEAYLKENLPILKQRFDDQNLEYDELNRRERRNPDKEQNRKKGRNDE